MPLRGIRIIAVDDDPDALELANTILSGAGATVATAVSAPEAIGFLTRHWNPRVVITDLQMPGMSGFSLLAEMRKHYADIPVLVFTAYYDEPGWATRVRALGADVIRKDAHPTELVRAVTALLRTEPGC